MKIKKKPLELIGERLTENKHSNTCLLILAIRSESSLKIKENDDYFSMAESARGN